MPKLPADLDWSSSLHILNQISDAVMVVDLDGRIIDVNAELCNRVGFDRSRLIGERPSIWHKEKDVDSLTDAIIAECLNSGNWRGEVDYRDAEGREKLSDLFAQTLTNEDGEVVAILSVSRDITERSKLELQLRHDQRMKAVGALTGGIAHDFNNILSIILGNLDLILLQPNSKKTPERLQIAMEAAKQGTSLTQRLLAFARQQPLSPDALEPASVLKNLNDLLTSSLGEEIDLEIVYGGGLWRCYADRQQLETVILNLAINARDAMPNGGGITIEVFNARLDDDYARSHDEVEPGQYVCFAVTDDGVGMTPEIASQAFDPFFTTKAFGEGSGLGLSMAMGFAKQSGGHIKIYSEPGKGTTIKLYLPRTTEAARPHHREASHPDMRFLKGKKILLVEDDLDLRFTMRENLLSFGCRVDESESATNAIETCRTGVDYDLLLIDVILPGGMDGRQLSKALLDILPPTPVVFMSGYTENAIIHNNRLDPGIVLLQKPFTRSELASVLIRALDQPG